MSSIPNKRATINPPTPITCFTGWLGAGKTTIILNLIKALNVDSNNNSSSSIVWLKNEYGDLQVDSVLAKQHNLITSEIINGCICCTAIGKLSEALIECRNTLNPSRIILETSGSSFPAPIYFEIQRINQQNNNNNNSNSSNNNDNFKENLFQLDAMICVIDCVNFKGYNDLSYTAKLQTKCTDLILYNKHELVTEAQFETVADKVFELNELTPKIKTNKGNLDNIVDVLLGLDNKLFQKYIETYSESDKSTHNNNDDINVISITAAESHLFDRQAVIKFLESLNKESFYRVKGMINFIDQNKQLYDQIKSIKTPEPLLISQSQIKDDTHMCTPESKCDCDQHQHNNIKNENSMTKTEPLKSLLLNFAFGRYQLHDLDENVYSGPTRLTIMGDHTLRSKLQQIAHDLQLRDTDSIKML